MCLLVNFGRACSRHCASRVRESSWRGIILWLVAFLGDGAFIWGLPARSKKQRGAQSSSFTDSRLFRHEKPKRMETFPSPLIQLQTWLTLTEGLVSILSCYSVRSYELTDFLSSKPACQLLAEFPLKQRAAQPGGRISPPAETGNQPNSFTGCVSSWEVWEILILQKSLDHWTVGEKSPANLHFIHPFSHYSLHFW